MGSGKLFTFLQRLFQILRDIFCGSPRQLIGLTVFPIFLEHSEILNFEDIHNLFTPKLAGHHSQARALPDKDF